MYTVVHPPHRQWRHDAAPALAGCAVLAVLLAVYTATLGAGINADQGGPSLTWLWLELFLIYRCYRGGAIAWALLVILHGVPLLLMTLGLAGWPGWYAVGLVALIAVPLVLLSSPAVRARVFAQRPLHARVV